MLQPGDGRALLLVGGYFFFLLLSLYLPRLVRGAGVSCVLLILPVLTLLGFVAVPVIGVALVVSGAWIAAGAWLGAMVRGKSVVLGDKV